MKMLIFEGECSPQDTIQFIEEQCGIGLWTWSPEARKMEWSPGFFRLLGLAAGSEEPSQALFESMIHPEDVQPPGEIERILTHGTAIERTFRLIQHDGRVRYVVNRGEVLFDRNGKLSKAVGVLLDVTQLNEARNSATAIHARYSALVEMISAFVWVANHDGSVDDLPFWRTLTGQSIGEIRDEGWLNALHPDDRARVKGAWESAVAGRRPVDVEYRVRRADGAYRWFRAQGKPLFKQDGAVREWIGCCIDIHDQKVWQFSACGIMTGAQLRAARGILNWSVRNLADAANVSASTIRRLEETNGPLTDSTDTLAPLLETLERAGIEFLFPLEGKAGVRPR